MRHKAMCSQHVAELFYLKNLLTRSFEAWKHKYKFDRYLKFVNFLLFFSCEI